MRINGPFHPLAPSPRLLTHFAQPGLASRLPLPGACIRSDETLQCVYGAAGVFCLPIGIWRLEEAIIRRKSGSDDVRAIWSLVDVHA